MDIITRELLESLLSPAREQRSNAEHYLQQMTVTDRCTAWCRALQQQQQGLSQLQEPHYQQLMCVLLRRDIILLPVDDPTFPKQMSTILLHVWDSWCTAGRRPASCLTALGDCLAEICHVLAYTAPNDSIVTMQDILQHIGWSLSQADPNSMKLFISLADRSPRAFSFVVESSLDALIAQSAHAIIQAYSNTTTTTTTGFETAQQAMNKDQRVALLLELVVTAACALGGPGLGNNSSVSSSLLDPSQPASRLGSTALLPLLVGDFARLLTQDTRQAFREHLLHAAEWVPGLLAGDATVFRTVLQSLLMLEGPLYSSKVEERLQSIEIVMTLCAHKSVQLHRLSAPGVREGLAKECVPSLIEMMALGCNDDLEEGWATDPNPSSSGSWAERYPEEDYEVSNHAAQLLEACLQSLGVVAFECLLLQIQPALLSPDWKRNRAALVALECGLVAAPKAMHTHIGSATEAALSFANSTVLATTGSSAVVRQSSQHVRVQHQALVVLGLLCETGQVQQSYASSILQSLAQASHSSCGKIAATACAAIVSFCRPSSIPVELDLHQIMRPFLSDVLLALMTGPMRLDLSTPDAIEVTAQAVGAVACLAQAGGEEFAPHYATVMPSIVGWSRVESIGVHSYDISRLRGRALQVASIVGQAIGPDNQSLFAADAEDIMKRAVHILNLPDPTSAGVPLDDLLAACSRIASVFGQAYVPYLHVIVPHLLQLATHGAGVDVSDVNEQGFDAFKGGEQLEIDEEKGTESMTVAVPGRGLTKVSLNTTQIQEKEQATRASYEIASALGSSFGPWASVCLEAFCPLVHFPYSADLRAASAQTLSVVFEASCSYGESAGMTVPKHYLPLVAAAIATQMEAEDTTEMEVMNAFADSLSSIFYSVFSRRQDFGEELLQNYLIDNSRTVVHSCMKTMAACVESRIGIIAMLEGVETELDGIYDLDDCNDNLANGQGLLTDLVDSVGYNLKLFKQEFVSIFETEVAPVLRPYLNASCDSRARVAAVCLFDDCVEHCGSSAAACFSPFLVEGAVAGMDGNDEDLTSASIYGIAKIARYAPASILSPYAPVIMQRLASIISRPKVDADNQAIYENALSALCSMVLFGNAPFKSICPVKLDAVVESLCESMPLREDEDEAKFCSSGLCDLVENGTMPVVPDRVARLVQIIGDTLALVSEGEDLASPDTCVRFVGILFRLQHQVKPDDVREAFRSLSTESRLAIDKAFMAHPHPYANVVTP